MQLNDIKLSDKQLFEKYAQKSGVTSQFIGFVNLFLWRKGEKIQYFFIDNALIVTGESPENKRRYFMFPKISDITKNIILSLKENFGSDFSIMALSQEDVNYLKNMCGDLLTFNHLRDMDNYIYLSENLINLSGRKYHSKKNHVNSFKKSYNYEYFAYTEEYRKNVSEFLGKWYISKDEADDTLFKETNSIMSAIDNMNELNLKGGIIMVDEKVVAFSIGEKMTSDMAVIHFEKADTDYNGSYAIINNEFVKNEWSHLKYINREEDMGIEGLRKSKLSYKPEIIFEVYEAHLTENGNFF